jgi:hypothetical protein
VGPALNNETKKADPNHIPQPNAEERAHFRRTLAKVMSMQVVALVLLWLLQSHYAG